MFDIHEELKKLPQKSGVYFMKDEDETVIYVGKAVNLRNRVRQYFSSSMGGTPKNAEMVPKIHSFEYIVTENEIDALILECNLIKKYWPKYNILLKDDKSYPYLKLTVNESYPRLFITKRHEKDKAKYFGPYSSSMSLQETLEVIFQIWPLRRCSKKFPQEQGRERVCLNYHIGKCLGPCNDLISEEEYNRMAAEAAEFINGRRSAVLDRLETEMRRHAENLEFEKAAELRDKISNIKRLDEKQSMEINPDVEQDIIAMARSENEALVQVFFIRGGKMTGREHFMLENTAASTRLEIMTEFVKHFYGETTFIPKEIILESDITEKDLISKWLAKIKGHAVTITVPQRGDKTRYVRMAAENAALTLGQFGEQFKREQQRTVGALWEISDALGLGELSRIEAYDISNIQGYENVGSMVAFEDGRPKRSDYRKFKIKTVIGANDYASMEEVITRRFNRYQREKEQVESGMSPANAKFLKLPDIIFMDGGKIQVSAAEKILRDLGLDIPVCGMVKDDRHRTRALLFLDREIAMPLTSEGFKLVTRIQDEVHRFAVEYHRKLREKTMVRSVLDDIEGVGPTRRKALLKHFGSVEKIQDASLEELAAVKPMTQPSAEAVYNFFKTEKQHKTEFFANFDGPV
ncbi:MAG: excinuclease ABC subunit UvrC [Clostridiales bacterium]|jgi:excinuclease ABC subunit C|nr:excinuclease ABC subunit UvrC [Clostridiales bacterium]